MKLHQSGNKIIVTELNPMSDAALDGTDILLMSKFGSLFRGCNYGIGDRFTISGVGSYEQSNFIGWLPIPVYNPSAKSPSGRYEKLIKLNPLQFAELYERNMSGENFDEMVDAL